MTPYIAGQNICRKKKHTQNPVDHLFIDVFNKFIKQKSSRKKTPVGKRIKRIIQDQIDTNLNLTEISKSLSIHPSYLSREFSKDFNNLSFGQSHFTGIVKLHPGKNPSVFKKEVVKGKADTKG
jgi:hypothetical protein